MPNPKTTPDYLRAAKANLNEANNTYSPEQYVGHISAAQAQATIALAEEQRTANLIALLDQIPAPHGREKLHEMILERLGLS